MSKQEIGQRGEVLAREFLEHKGFQFLAANWSCKMGEIDLVMQDGPTRVFVEVRTRAKTTFGAGFDTVASQKQAKLVRATRFYQNKEDYWGDIRFDVVSIVHDAGNLQSIDHIEHAFEG